MNLLRAADVQNFTAKLDAVARRDEFRCPCHLVARATNGVFSWSHSTLSEELGLRRGRWSEVSNRGRPAIRPALGGCPRTFQWQCQNGTWLRRAGGFVRRNLASGATWRWLASGPDQEQCAGRGEEGGGRIRTLLPVSWTTGCMVCHCVRAPRTPWG